MSYSQHGAVWQDGALPGCCGAMASSKQPKKICAQLHGPRRKFPWPELCSCAQICRLQLLGGLGLSILPIMAAAGKIGGKRRDGSGHWPAMMLCRQQTRWWGGLGGLGGRAACPTLGLYDRLSDMLYDKLTIWSTLLWLINCMTIWNYVKFETLIWKDTRSTKVENFQSSAKLEGNSRVRTLHHIKFYCI